MCAQQRLRSAWTCALCLIGLHCLPKDTEFLATHRVTCGDSVQMGRPIWVFAACTSNHHPPTPCHHHPGSYLNCNVGKGLPDCQLHLQVAMYIIQELKKKAAQMHWFWWCLAFYVPFNIILIIIIKSYRDNGRMTVKGCAKKHHTVMYDELNSASNKIQIQDFLCSEVGSI